jgi:hypothetical protein
MQDVVMLTAHGLSLLSTVVPHDTTRHRGGPQLTSVRPPLAHQRLLDKIDHCHCVNCAELRSRVAKKFSSMFFGLRPPR